MPGDMTLGHSPGTRAWAVSEETSWVWCSSPVPVLLFKIGFTIPSPMETFENPVQSGRSEEKDKG